MVETSSKLICIDSYHKVLIPENPYSSNALEIAPLLKANLSKDGLRFNEFGLLKSFANYWFYSNKNVNGFYIIQNRDDFSGHNSLQFIPYVKSDYWIGKIIQQIIVIWNMLVPRILAIASSIFYQDKPKEDLIPFLHYDHVSRWKYKDDPLFNKNSPFDNPEQVKKQLVFEGKRVKLLLNYNPLSKLDFLIIANAKPKGFPDLEYEDYKEAMDIADKIKSHYSWGGKKIVAVASHATGSSAGQTVPEWHLHLTIALSRTEKIFGYFKVMGKMIGASGPLTNDQLKERVTHLKEELKNVL